MKYVLCVLLVVLSLAGLGSVPLFDVDEAVFSQAAREMVEKGEWITPTYNDNPRYDKPILLYWMMAFSFSLFGVNEFGARFPSAVSGIALTIALFLFVRRFSDEGNALRVATVLAVSILYFAYSHAAVTDMTLALLISLALFCFFVWSQEGKIPYLYGFYVFSALAFLTKGLVGIVFPLGIAVLYLTILSGPRATLRIFSVPGILLFLVIAGPWYVAQYAINGDEFLQQFFVKHHFRRYTGVISGHKGAFYYYLPVLLIGFFPWSAYIASGVREAVLAWRVRSRIPGDNLTVFCLIWGASVVLFFSFSTTKLPNYILPSLPAFAILAVRGMSSDARWARFSHGFAALMSFALSVGCLIGRPHLSKIDLSDDTWAYWFAAVFAGTGITGMLGAFRGYMLLKTHAMLMIVLLVIVSVKVLPQVHNYLQGTLYQYSVLAGRGTGEGEKILVYRINNPSILFYSNRRIINPFDKATLDTAVAHTKDPLVAIAKSRDKGDLEMLGFVTLQDDGRYALLERK